MVLIANIMIGIANVLAVCLQLVLWVVVINALLSWVNPDPNNPIVRFLNDSTDPLLRPIRRHVPLIGPGIDISPIILLLAIVFLQQVLVRSLVEYAQMLK